MCVFEDDAVTGEVLLGKEEQCVDTSIIAIKSPRSVDGLCCLVYLFLFVIISCQAVLGASCAYITLTFPLSNKILLCIYTFSFYFSLIGFVLRIIRDTHTIIHICTSTNNHTCLYGECSRVGVCEKVLGGGAAHRPRPYCNCKIALCFLNSERLKS